jgi:hypothetical protein
VARPELPAMGVGTYVSDDHALRLGLRDVPPAILFLLLTLAREFGS